MAPVTTLLQNGMDCYSFMLLIEKMTDLVTLEPDKVGSAVTSPVVVARDTSGSKTLAAAS